MSKQLCRPPAPPQTAAPVIIFRTIVQVRVFPENLPDKLLTLPIMVLENSKLVKMTVPHIAPWLPMRLSGDTLLLKLFTKN